MHKNKMLNERPGINNEKKTSNVQKNNITIIVTIPDN